MRQKIQALLTHLNHGLVDREPALKAALLTVLAGENIVLIGPPGTGKSLLARRIAQGLGGDQGLRYFEYLLTKFSTPEELFGPLSITALKSDRFHRNTDGYLPSVELAFLDEVFKASSSILNALLTLMNERIFHNGADPQHAPLRALIAASNELPADKEELAALYDRFLLRCFVDYVSPDRLPHLLAASAAGSAPPLADPITGQDMERLKTAIEAVTLPPEAAQALQQIWHAHRDTFKEDRREQLSDRRLMKCLHLLRVSAATNGRTVVDLSDVLLLKDCLWNHPDNRQTVQQLVLDVLLRHSRPVPVGQPLQLVDGSPAPSHSECLTYEVGSDGTTLVPVVAPSASRAVLAAAAPAPTLGQATGQKNAVVKGFYGSGTEHDPLLVQSVEDLMDMTRPEVGMKGYHFRQTADIDCSGIGSWFAIELQGIFDGDGFTVMGPENDNYLYFLLNTTHPRSVIKNVKLKNMALIGHAIESEIYDCQSNKFLAWTLDGSYMLSCSSKDNLCRTVVNSEIKYCSTDLRIVEDKAEKSKFFSCAAGDSFFYGDVIGCQIQDCLTNINPNSHKGFSSRELIYCQLEKCFVYSRNHSSICGHTGESGFTPRLASGYIKNSFLGFIKDEEFKFRICSELKDTSKLSNNYSADTNHISQNYRFDYSESDKDGRQGQSISAQLATQRFFENTLGWDFENIWYWDDANNQPALRHAGVGARPAGLQAAVAPLAAPADDTDMADLLTQQVKANIWL
ncbi:ATPase RavA [uncultured Comamonas sp.]|nr:ATPase RavA [uncultured Comamonas sp.]